MKIKNLLKIKKELNRLDNYSDEDQIWDTTVMSLLLPSSDGSGLIKKDRWLDFLVFLGQREPKIKVYTMYTKILRVHKEVVKQFAAFNCLWRAIDLVCRGNIRLLKKRREAMYSAWSDFKKQEGGSR